MTNQNHKGKKTSKFSLANKETASSALLPSGRRIRSSLHHKHALKLGPKKLTPVLPKQITSARAPKRSSDYQLKQTGASNEAVAKPSGKPVNNSPGAQPRRPIQVNIIVETPPKQSKGRNKQSTQHVSDRKHSSHHDTTSHKAREKKRSSQYSIASKHPTQATPESTPKKGSSQYALVGSRQSYHQLDEETKKNLYGSVMNIHRLTRDGRKTPEDYKQTVTAVSSPSQLSLRTISEHYHIPDQNFSTPDEVFLYRGYKKLGKIDEGAFGIVSKAMRVTDRAIVAVKEVDLRRKRNKRIEEMKRELFVLQKIDNPNIVKLIEHFIVEQTLVIVMEYCAGSNLTTYLKKVAIDEEEAMSLFGQMAQAIKVLHKKGIAHRDVKLNNFLLDATRKIVKVGDFGLSVVTYRRSRGIIMAKTYCGTEPYMAPEILRRNSMGVRSYNPLFADIWSLGICLFAMLTRTFPFKMHLSQRGLYKAQVSRRWRFPKGIRNMMSEELKDLVWHMLDPEPERRIKINGVVAHPWLNHDRLVDLSLSETE